MENMLNNFSSPDLTNLGRNKLKPYERMEINRLAALKLSEAGFAILPIGLNKVPRIKSFQTEASSDRTKVDKWFDGKQDVMPGLLTGRRNRIAVLDIDIKGKSNGFESLSELGFEASKMSHVRITTQSGGAHLYFEWVDGIKCRTGVLEGIDVRGEGGFVVGPGAVSKIGEYTVECTHIVDDPIGLPVWPEFLMRKKFPSSTLEDQKPMDMDFPTFKSAVLSIPNDGSLTENDDRDWWLRILMSVHNHTQASNEGLALVHEWSSQHHSYNEGNTNNAWRSLT